MKNIIKLGCFVVVLITLLVSCGSTKPVVMQNETITEKTVTTTLHDTIFRIEKDSSFYKALLECQNGKVIVRNVIQSEPGRNLKSPKVRIENNSLKVDCEKEAEELFAQWKETYIKEHQTEIVQVPVTTNILTWWQQTQIKLFWLFSIILLGLTIWQIIKSKF